MHLKTDAVELLVLVDEWADVSKHAGDGLHRLEAEEYDGAAREAIEEHCERLRKAMDAKQNPGKQSEIRNSWAQRR